eukprot:gene15548-650_t
MEQTKGTVRFMAPEVLLEEQYNYKVDVWSVGCLLIELLTGQPPYPGHSGMMAVMTHIMGFRDGTTTLQLPQGLSPDALAFIADCMQPEAHRRPSVQTLLMMNFITKHDVVAMNQANIYTASTSHRVVSIGAHSVSHSRRTSLPGSTYPVNRQVTNVDARPEHPTSANSQALDDNSDGDSSDGWGTPTPATLNQCSTKPNDDDEHDDDSDKSDDWGPPTQDTLDKLDKPESPVSANNDGRKLSRWNFAAKEVIDVRGKWNTTIKNVLNVRGRAAIREPTDDEQTEISSWGEPGENDNRKPSCYVLANEFADDPSSNTIDLI